MKHHNPPGSAAEKSSPTSMVEHWSICCVVYSIRRRRQGCRGYGDSHGYGMGMGTVMNPHGFCG